MRKWAWVVAVLFGMGLVGCAQKSESEKMMDQMKKDTKRAADQMKRDIDKL